MDSFFLLFLFNRRERAEVLQLFTSYTKKWEIASDRVFNFYFSYEQRVTYELCMHESRLLRNASGQHLFSSRGEEKIIFAKVARCDLESESCRTSTIETANSDYSYVLIRLIACIYCVIHRMRVSSKRNQPVRRSRKSRASFILIYFTHLTFHRSSQ